MTEWIKCLFRHDWKIIGRHCINYYDRDVGHMEIVSYGTIFLLQCQRCGKIKSKELKGYFLEGKEGLEE